MIAGAVRALALVLCVTALTAAGAAARAEEGGRVALVIGNGRYEPPERALAAAGDDARLVAAALARAGFDVDLVIDADAATLTEALARLSQRIAAATEPPAGFVYFAGHARAERGQTRLLPVDDDPAPAAADATEPLGLGLVFDALRPVPAGRAFVALDACRGPPTEAQDEACAPAATARSQAPLVAAAAGPEAAGPDASGSIDVAPGAFAAALADTLEREALDAEDVFARAARRTQEASAGARTVWVEPGADGEPFYFHPPTEANFETRVAEAIRWGHARRAATADAFRDYLAADPDGRYAEAAWAHIESAELLVAARAPIALPVTVEGVESAGVVAAMADARRAAAPTEPAPAAKFRMLEAEDMLVLETTKGRLVVELFPELAPESVARVRELAREGWLDGAPFDPVVDDLYAGVRLRPPATQTPVAALPRELLAPSVPGASTVAVADIDRGRVGAYALGDVSFGVYKGLAVARSADGEDVTWVSLCPGVVAAGGLGDGFPAPGFQIMLAEAPALDASAEPWGRVVDGLDGLYELAAGASPTSAFEPDVIVSARVAADLSEADAQALFEDVRGMLDETRPGFAEFVASLREELGREPRVCEIRLPVVGARALASSSPAP